MNLEDQNLPHAQIIRSWLMTAVCTLVHKSKSSQLLTEANHGRLRPFAYLFYICMLQIRLQREDGHRSDMLLLKLV